MSTNGDRVADAYQNNLSKIQQYISVKGINPDSFQLHLRAYKVEALLEAWIKSPKEEEWVLLKTYPFCISSGTPGPKRKEGDLQIPEGFYHINRFNPKSKFHLSLGLNYPNTTDRILGDANRPGSDIFIHGGCKSVGCIAITDVLIAELYVIASEAQKQGQDKIKVHLFPCLHDYDTLNKLIRKYPEHKQFWKTLLEEEEHFRKTKRLLQTTSSVDGQYLFSH